METNCVKCCQAEKYQNKILLSFSSIEGFGKLIKFNNTISPFALVGYEMIIANLALRASLAIYLSYPTGALGIIFKYTKIELKHLSEDVCCLWLAFQKFTKYLKR